MLVAIEGLDGSGKTAVCAVVAALVSGTYVKVPPPELELKSSTLLNRIGSAARYLYYLAGVSAIAEAATDEASILICDRYIASAHALHIAVSTDMQRALTRLPIRPPDLSFFLHVDEPERRRRLVERGQVLDTFERMLRDDETFRQGVAARMRESPGIQVLDTTWESPAELGQVVASAIWQHQTETNSSAASPSTDAVPSPASE